jgi:hypothetical protein
LPTLSDLAWADAAQAGRGDIGPGMDNPGLYVSLSRDKGQAILFGARAELEGEREELVDGPPRTVAACCPDRCSSGPRTSALMPDTAVSDVLDAAEVVTART